VYSFPQLGPHSSPEKLTTRFQERIRAGDRVASAAVSDIASTDRPSDVDADDTSTPHAVLTVRFTVAPPAYDDSGDPVRVNSVDGPVDLTK
jgi:hypothetical protein